MARKISDGWHDIAGHRVYVEDGHILRGLSSDRQRTVFVYRASRFGGWDKEDGITPDAFRAGLRRGTIKMT